MFVFVMIAMVSTISTVHSSSDYSSDGTEYKLKPLQPRKETTKNNLKRVACSKYGYKSCWQNLKSETKDNDRKRTDSYEDDQNLVPKLNKKTKLKRVMSWSSSSEFEVDVKVIKQKLEESDSFHSDNHNCIDENKNCCDSNNESHSKIQDNDIDKMPSLKDIDLCDMYDYDDENQLNIANEFDSVAEKDGKQIDIESKDFINKERYKERGPVKKLWPSDNEANHQSECQAEMKRSTPNEQMSVENTCITPSKVKKVKKGNLFEHFLGDQDLVKNALIHATRENSFERIPVMASEENDYVVWNVNVEKVVHLHIRPEIQNYQTESLKFVNDVFSRIPDTELPIDYDFYFDTSTGYRNWFMLAVHKRENDFIGRKWNWVSKNTFETVDWAPCDARNRWIKRSSCTDKISKALLANGFNFAPRDTPNLKRKRQDSRAKSEKPGSIPTPQDGQGERIFRTEVQKAEKLKQIQYEYNLSCALESKFEKSAMFLLSSFCDVKGQAPPDPLELGDLVFLTEDYHMENNVMTPESWTPFSFVLNDENIKKAFYHGLSEPFKIMMEYKKWPENLWNHVLESENQQSKEMMKLLCERIKKFEKTEHLSILLKANDNGKMPFFEKIMHLAANDDPKTTAHFKESLKDNFQKVVLHQVYQCLLFFGVAKADIKLCKFALNGPRSFCASLQEKTDNQVASAMENKCYWRKNGKNNCSEDRGYQKKENPIEPKKQEYTEDTKKTDQITVIKQEDMDETTKNGKTILPVKYEITENVANLENKTALEIAIMLCNSQGGSCVDKRSLKNIKSYLEDEAKQRCKVKKEVKEKTEAKQYKTDVKGKVEKVTISLDTDSEDGPNDKKDKDIK